MPRYTDHVYSRGFRKQGQFAEALDVIYVKKTVGILSLYDFCRFLHGLDGADLIIYMHDGDQDGVVPEGIA